MGMFMLQDDIYIGILLQQLNLRFGPESDQIGEMVELQRKFTVFSPKHSFADSVLLLGLAGNWSAAIKNKWYQLLDSYRKVPSDRKAQSGDQRIVAVLMEDLASKPPSPVHFTAHDSRKNPRVTVRLKSSPIFYITSNFITISLPMKPRS